MDGLSISLITVSFNAAATIEGCIRSVIAQNYPHLQYIIIDGGSTDGTLAILNNYKDYISILVSEPDKGLYDAMNKGIALAAGNIVGTLNADDCFASNDVLIGVAEAFKRSNADIIYGDLNYINKKNMVVRKWRASTYRTGSFNFGWMPPHPTFYARLQCFKRFGAYDLSYGSAADYELMIRFIHTGKMNAHYTNKLMVNMLLGGVSNKNIKSRMNAWQNDRRAMEAAGIVFPWLIIFFKPLRKILQYF